MVPGILLTENADSTLEYVIESHEDKSKPKTYRFKGPWMVCDSRNRNGRVYPYDIVKPEIERYYNEYVVTKRAISNLDHPTSPTQMFENACHLIEDIKLNESDKTVYGIAKILDTPSGRIAKTLMDEGVQLAISSRGLGQLSPDGVVGDNYKIFAWDLVVSPSCQTAFVENIIENQQYIIQDDKLVAVNMEELKKNLSKNGTRNLYNDLNTFLKKLNNKL